MQLRSRAFALTFTHVPDNDILAQRHASDSIQLIPILILPLCAADTTRKRRQASTMTLRHDIDKLLPILNETSLSWRCSCDQHLRHSHQQMCCKRISSFSDYALRHCTAYHGACTRGAISRCRPPACVLVRNDRTCKHSGQLTTPSLLQRLRGRSAAASAFTGRTP